MVHSSLEMQGLHLSQKREGRRIWGCSITVEGVLVTLICVFVFNVHNVRNVSCNGPSEYAWPS